MHSIFAMPLLARLSAIITGLVFTSLFSFAQAQTLPEIQKLLKQGQLPQALDQANSYISSKPKDPQGRFIKGLILTDMGKTQEAIAVFTKMTEEFPELPEPYNNLAVLYAQQKQYDKARMALEMAIKTHPSYSTAHENLGDVYAKLASQAYGKALQIDSGNAATQTKLSMIKDLITPAPGSNSRPNVSPSTSASISTTTTSTNTKTNSQQVVASIQPPKQAVAHPATGEKPAEMVKPLAVPPQTSQPVEKTPEKIIEKPTVEQPKVASAPEKKAEKPPVKENNINAEVTKTLENWANAWSKKDVKAYLGFYAKSFQTPGGQSRKAWEEERKQRIDKPGKLLVTLSNIRVSGEGNKATAKFRQQYVSSTLKSNASKTVMLVKNGNNWQITQEMVN